VSESQAREKSKEESGDWEKIWMAGVACENRKRSRGGAYSIPGMGGDTKKKTDNLIQKDTIKPATEKKKSQKPLLGKGDNRHDHAKGASTARDWRGVDRI